MGVYCGIFNQVALYGDRPFFKSCESGAVYTENNTPLRICFLWWDVKQGNWVNWFLSEKPPTTTGPSTAQDWSDLELVCRLSDNFKECFVPFNSTEPTNNGIQVYALWRVGIWSLHITSRCRASATNRGNLKIPTLPGYVNCIVGWESEILATDIEILKVRVTSHSKKDTIEPRRKALFGWVI